MSPESAINLCPGERVIVHCNGGEWRKAVVIRTLWARYGSTFTATVVVCGRSEEIAAKREGRGPRLLNFPCADVAGPIYENQ